MQITERRVGDVTILDLRGKIVWDEGAELLKGEIDDLIAEGRTKIVLNMTEVPYIDSSGLGEIVCGHKYASRQGGALKLLNLAKRIVDLLSITKLPCFSENFNSEDEAVQSFSPQPTAK